MNKKNSAGQTALFAGAKFGHYNVVKILLRNKANVNDLKDDGTSIL